MIFCVAAERSDVRGGSASRHYARRSPHLLRHITCAIS